MKDQRGLESIVLLGILMILLTAMSAWWFLSRLSQPTGQFPSDQQRDQLMLLSSTTAGTVHLGQSPVTGAQNDAGHWVPIVVGPYDYVPSGIDAATYQSFTTNACFTKDKNDVYVGSGDAIGADPDTFVPVGTSSEGTSLWHCYGKDQYAAYYGGYGYPRISGDIPNVDLSTFTANGDIYPYAEDARHIFFEQNIVVGADPQTFSIIASTMDSPYAAEFGYVFAKDAVHVFDSGSLLKGADPATFTFDGDTGVARDKNHVWVTDGDPASLIMVPNADLKTFSALNELYFTDSRKVFFESINAPTVTVSSIVADPATFRIFTRNYWQDEISGGDESASPGEEYAADKNAVYYNGQIIQGADPVTFGVVENNYSKGDLYEAYDKSHKYESGQVVN